MSTLSELMTKYDHEVYDHIVTELGSTDVPVLAGRQSQGDVRVAPLSSTKGVSVRSDAKWVAVPPQGIHVVRPLGNGHVHTLTSEPNGATWTDSVSDDEGLAVGVVKVSTEAYLAHAEHGYAGIAPGEYVIRRQREQADVQRIVAD